MFPNQRRAHPPTHCPHHHESALWRERHWSNQRTAPSHCTFRGNFKTIATSKRQQENYSALACHLFAHVKNLIFDTKAEVVEWCRTNILVDILWRSSTLSLVKMAGQKVCQLCATKRMIIGQNVTSSHRRRKILNLKSEMRGVCSRKARFLRFARSK